MLGELWKFIKASFKKRLVLYETVVISLTLFGTFPNPVVKLTSFFVFLAAGGLFFTLFTFKFLSQFWLILTHRKMYEVPVSDEIARLSNRMGVQIKKLRFREGLCNAYVLGKSLVLGIDLLKKLSFNERQGVVAHELGHIKEKHGMFRFLLTIPFLVIPWYSWSKLYSPIFFSESLTTITVRVMVGIAFLAYITLAMIPINWYLEVRADRIAAKFAGKENIKSALITIANKENLEEQSEDHPSISERVKLIEKLKL